MVRVEGKVRPGAWRSLTNRKGTGETRRKNPRECFGEGKDPTEKSDTAPHMGVNRIVEGGKIALARIDHGGGDNATGLKTDLLLLS